MQFELFENIKLERLEKLYNLIILNPKNFSDIKLIYLSDEIYFQEHINFLIDIDLVSVSKNAAVIKKKKLTTFKDLLLDTLCIKTVYASLIKDYLSNFEDNSKNIYSFKPNGIYNLSSSYLRNFLISLKIVKYIGDNYLILDNEILNKFLKTSYSPEQLRAELENKALLGLKAEELVFQMEKEKLSKINDKLLPNHIALKDIKAGYDILSYEKKDNLINKIYIEVKAVPPSNYRFYLSTNELSTAIRYKEFYYLYLLPVDKSNDMKFDYTKILKINNINNNIINNNDDWLIKNNVFEISKKK